MQEFSLPGFRSGPGLFTGLVAVSTFFCSPLWIPPSSAGDLNPLARSATLYEVQVRAANACRTDVGSPSQRAACLRKISPEVQYRGYGGDRSRCGSELPALEKIRLGTLDDMMEDTADHRLGITLKYIREKVGANTVWIMPLFPNNDHSILPHPCDNLGSPYAVRDYMHVQGKLSRGCIRMGSDENSAENGKTACYGNFAFDELLKKAHGMGLKVILDVALNHFGHDYLYFDYIGHTPIRDRIARGENLDQLWNYGATFDEALVRPEILDTESELNSTGMKAIKLQLEKKCPNLKGEALILAVGMWREALDWERERFDCARPMFLENQLPGFYTGKRDHSFPRPSKAPGDNFTNNWIDVKFLYHHEVRRNDGSRDYYQTLVRNREYFFRILNYWVSRGVDGFRLDHTTDEDSGLSPNTWKYLLEKVNHYAWIRQGRPRNPVLPIYLAEEFHDQMGMSPVVDFMIEGYVNDMKGLRGATKDASHVERVLEKDTRFRRQSWVMRALETHDEHRLTESSHREYRTGFDIWTGAGFWGIGAASSGVPMILMGQEFGEASPLEFRRSDFLQSRFEDTPAYHPEGDQLLNFYRRMNEARLKPANRGLLSWNRYYLRTRDENAVDPRIFAQARWEHDPSGSSILFTFHNLWKTGDAKVRQSYRIPEELSRQLLIQDETMYRLMNILNETQAGRCRSGSELKEDFYVEMDREERVQWLRLEPCR